MLWGHEVRIGNEKRKVTRADYNRSFGYPVPEKPEVPDHLRHVWLAWWRMNNRRRPAESICPIPHSEMESFARLTNEIFTPDDIRMIETIDDNFIGACTEEQKAMIQAKNENKPAARKR